MPCVAGEAVVVWWEAMAPWATGLSSLACVWTDVLLEVLAWGAE